MISSVMQPEPEHNKAVGTSNTDVCFQFTKQIGEPVLSSQGLTHARGKEDM